MALAGIPVLNAAILALTPLTNQHVALVNFVDAVADYMDQVQGAGGGPGILAVNRPVFVAMLETQSPVADDSWIAPFADAWYAGVAQGVITPGTVSNGAWAGGSSVDILTAPTGAATVINLTAARAILEAELHAVKGDNSAAIPIATAIHDATKAMIFLCIGLNPASVPTPVPVGAS